MVLRQVHLWMRLGLRLNKLILRSNFLVLKWSSRSFEYKTALETYESKFSIRLQEELLGPHVGLEVLGVQHNYYGL